MTTVSRYLVYGLIDPRSGELRYVGKSTRGMRRPRQHCSHSGRSRPFHAQAWLRNLFLDGGLFPSILVLRECEDDAEAAAVEIALIALFRSLGFPLTNLTDGGDGTVGHKVSKEAREVMRQKKLGKKPSEETRRRLSEAHIREGHTFSAEAREKARLATIARVVTPETREKMAAKKRGVKRGPIPPDIRAKMSAATKGRKMSDARRATMQPYWDSMKGKPVAANKNRKRKPKEDHTE